MPQTGRNTILLVQEIDAVLGSDALVMGYLTEHSHNISNEIANEATESGRVKDYGDNDESFDTTMYVEKGDAGQLAIKNAIRNKKKLKIWEVDINTNANGQHDATFAYVVAESYDKSSPAEGFEEISSTLQVIGESVEGELPPLPESVIEFGKYGFETPGETGTEAPATGA
jgi:TP901-1 family phage major tail protein